VGHALACQPAGRPAAPLVFRLRPRPPSVLQLETQSDVRLIKLRNRTSRLGVLHRRLKRLLAGAGNLGLQLQMALRDRETIAHFLERDGTRRLQTLRRQPRQPQLRGKRHGEASGVRGCQQFLGIGPLPVFKSRPEGIGCARKHPAGRRDLALTGLQIAAPLSVRCTFHEIWMQHGYPRKQES
jgi:hypothetical protein